MNRIWSVFLLVSILNLSCSTTDRDYIWKEKIVTASAYNSTVAQTDGQPSIAAWGDTLSPELKAIAVSRDLMRLGIERNTQVKIEGLDGIYLVKDKMHYRWRNKIDIYMGLNVEKAREWGRKKVKIYYRVKKDSVTNGK
ncbi:3D (Asp-Asp-Asp) domain-containing protein [Flavobacteriaceae bacterium MAR_2009_75]|nr:3D (Asp-Asp-Asp) domain-containing protein [Flavobacteriaceae bacterium MAR_2009_75]